MHDVAIVGAGELGGALAHVLARRDVAASIRLFDTSGQIAAGKALDIMQSSPIDGFATRVSGANDLLSIGGADIVVIADRGSAGEWPEDEALLLLRQIAGIAPRSVYVCAGAQARTVVERGVRELKFSRERLFGSAPEALASAIRAMVALETNGSAADVALTVLGIPPAQVVVPWEDAAIGGFGAARVLDEPARRRIAAKVAPLWPPGPYALATAAGEAIAAIAGRSRRTLSCFVAGGDGGQNARAAALPVRLGPGGILKVETPVLNASARVVLDNAMQR